jgi:glycosyltransferase involved in cell wall biosynthesis
MRVLMWEHFAPGGPIRVGGHHFAERFLRRGDQVAWCAGPLAPWNLLGGNDEIRARRRVWSRGGERLDGRTFAYAPLTWMPHRRRPLLDAAGVARRTLRATTPRFDRVLARAGFDAVDLLFMEPGGPLQALLDLYPGARSVYRMCDDTAAFPDTPRSFPEIEREVLQRADLVLATARTLEERARAQGARRVLYLPNACEPERFSGGSRPDPLLEALGRPLAIYAGAIEHWFDRELLADTARRLPGWRFALVGPERGAPGPLAGVRNIHRLGPRPYDDLPACFAAADAGIVPFRLTPMTHAIHPIKVYEYLAAGLPVVATPMRETAALRAPIALASDAAGFAAALETARAAAGGGDGDAARSARRAWTRGQTWDDRFAQLVAALDVIGAVDDRQDAAPRAVPRIAAVGGLR